MRHLTRRGPLIALAVVLVIAFGLTGVGIYGLVRGPQPGRPTHGTVASTSAAAASSPSLTPIPTGLATPPALPHTADPVAYARGVASAVFTWDAMSGLVPADYANAVGDDADPAGIETPGLVADLASYLPTEEVWQELRTYQTRETFHIDAARIPADWPTVRTQAGAELRPGTQAVTITGIRHRTGIWEGKHQAANTSVSFTVFVLCQPSYPDCHVLRLSQLDDPLK